jgi:hypothetical protein
LTAGMNRVLHYETARFSDPTGGKGGAFNTDFSTGQAPFSEMLSGLCRGG